MKKTLVVCMIFAAFAGGIFAEDMEMPRLEVSTARANGMGGGHVAYTDNVFALLVNPAALMRVRQRSFFAISPTLLSPESTVSLINPFLNMMSDMGAIGDAADIIQKKNGKIPLGADIREFPLSIAWAADGFGFGLWNRTFMNPNINGEWLDINVYADVMLPVGFGFRILDAESHSVDAGLTIKPFIRVMGHAKEKITALMDEERAEEFFNGITFPVIAGAGLDLGFLYRWDMGLSAGLTFNDILTRGSVVYNIQGKDDNSYYVPFAMNMGVAYDFKLGQFWISAPGFLSKLGFTFMFDWHNVFNVFQQDDYAKRNALLDLSAGIQISMFDMFMLRAGMNEMLPAFGIGFDLGPFQLDAAYYGKELGKEPGQLSAAALDLTIAIRPGAQKRNWPWARRSLVGLIAKNENL